MSGGDDMNPDGKVEDGSADGDECPNCGAKMEGGKCPQCGYEAKPEGGGDQDEDDGY